MDGVPKVKKDHPPSLGRKQKLGLEAALRKQQIAAHSLLQKELSYQAGKGVGCKRENPAWREITVSWIMEASSGGSLLNSCGRLLPLQRE